MSIVNKIESISNHLTDAYNSLENIGVDLTNIDKNIENLSTQIESVYSDLPKVVDENTEITLSPTKKGKMELILKGNTSQDGTPTPDFPVDVNVVSGSNVIKTSNKNLFNKDTVVNQSNYSGSVGQVISIATNSNTFRCPIFKKISDKITISANVTSAKMGVLLLDKDYKILSTTSYTTLPRTIDTSNCEFIAIFFDKTTITINNNIQIESNSTATTYEPHQGKEFPLDLPVENLFNKNNAEKYTGFTNGSDYKVNYNTAIKSIIIPCKKNTTYTVSKINGGNYDRFNIASFTTKPTTGTIASKYVGDNSLTSLTITTGPNDTYIMVLYYHTSETVYSENDILDSIQIEKGSKANAYTPYGTTPIELCKIGTYQDSIKKSTGKNLFNKDFHIINGSYINGSGGITSDSTLSYQDYFIEVEQNTEYTISSNVSTIYRIAKYDSSKNFINIPYNENQSTSYTINTGNAKYIKMAGTLTTALDSLQIEKGSSATTYEPYGKVWYVKKGIGKFYSNSTIGWSYDNNHRCYKAIDNIVVPPNNDTVGQGFCNVGLVTANQTLPNSTTSGLAIHPISRLYINENVYNNISTTPTVLYYVYITPTYTEITYQPLIDQLNELKKAISYKNQTNISQINNDLSFIISASALMKNSD